MFGDTRPRKVTIINISLTSLIVIAFFIACQPQLEEIGSAVTPLDDSWEIEPNNSCQQVNGPLHLGKEYYGYPNDEWDFFMVDLDAEGQITLDLIVGISQTLQLQLRDQTCELLIFAYEQPYHVEYTGVDASKYYIGVFTESSHSSEVPYSLRTGFEMLSAPTAIAPLTATVTLSSIPISTPTPAVAPTSTLTLIPAVYSDEFDELDENVWEAWSNADVNLDVREGALHAERDRTKTQGWGDTAGIRLKDQLDFSGVGTTITWRATIYLESFRSLMYSGVRDRDADRVLYFDCGTGVYESSHTCTATLRPLSGGEDEIWTRNITASVTKGKWHDFTIVNPSPRQVEFYIDDALLTSHTFSESEWNGMDWVTPEWTAIGWDGYNNLIHTSLDFYSHGRQ